MSHVTWAKAQRCSRNAKAALTAFASYADASGRGWAAITVMSVEASVSERSVQRGLAEARQLDLIRDTGEQHLHAGKLYPVYELQLDKGPKNTRQRLREDRNVNGLEEIGVDLGVSVCHPKLSESQNLSNSKAKPATAHADKALGCQSVTPRNATGDRLTPLRVTACHPNKKPKLSSLEANASRSECARAPDRSIFRTALAAYPKSGRGLTDLAAAQAAWIATDEPELALLAAVKAYAADPSLKRRDFGSPSFQKWLIERRFEVWLFEDPPLLSPAANAVWTGEPALRVAIVARLGEDFAAAYLDPCGWEAGQRALIPRTGFAADSLRRRAGAELLEFKVSVRDVNRPGEAA